MKDLFGKALLDYYLDSDSEDLVTATNISEDDVLPVSYLFRDYADMPKIEQEALKLCEGKILDVGCGSGSHSLFLQNKGEDVKAIDISPLAIKVAQLRGIKKTEVISVFELKETFDTILLLMNGTGIFQEMKQLPKSLQHLKSLLNPGGKILLDSSDIIYMYEDEDGGIWIDTNSRYYGELEYFLSYKGEEELPMKWLYLDFNTLKKACKKVGLKCELVSEGEHFDYLAKLTLS